MWSLSFLVGTISNVLVMEIGWTDVLTVILVSIFIFASIKCILNSLESISIWYQMQAYSITCQLNQDIYTWWLSNFVRREKPNPPFLKWKKPNIFSLNSLDKKYFVLNCDLCYTKPNKYITFNKSSTSNPLWSDLCGQNTWKMGYFQFCRFSQDSAYILILLIK